MQTDSSGSAVVSYYNTDPTGEVLVEAISDTGATGYTELVYKVKKANP